MPNGHDTRSLNAGRESQSDWAVALVSAFSINKITAEKLFDEMSRNTQANQFLYVFLGNPIAAIKRSVFVLKIIDHTLEILSLFKNIHNVYINIKDVTNINY